MQHLRMLWKSRAVEKIAHPFCFLGKIGWPGHLLGERKVFCFLSSVLHSTYISQDDQGPTQKGKTIPTVQPAILVPEFGSYLMIIHYCFPSTKKTDYADLCRLLCRAVQNV